MKLLEYFNDGYLWVVDIDLEKFFDNVPQDKLMSYVGRVIRDGDTESLIRKYLKVGVMENGIYKSTDIGTPQGGSLSPFLSNIMLNELDRELESRGQHFTRYADDVVIVVKKQSGSNKGNVCHNEVDRKGTWLKGKCNKNKDYPTKQTKIPRIWILERQRGMESKTARGLFKQV